MDPAVRDINDAIDSIGEIQRNDLQDDVDQLCEDAYNLLKKAERLRRERVKSSEPVQ